MRGPPFHPRGQSATHTLASFGPLISTSPGSQRSWHHPPGAHCAPHHCRRYVTFSAGGAEWGRTKRTREGRKRGEQKEKTSGEICLSSVVKAKTQQAFLKHESPLMELSDKSYIYKLWKCFSLCLCLCVCDYNTSTEKQARLSLCPWLPSNGDLMYLVLLCDRHGGKELPLTCRVHTHFAHLNKYK